MGKRIKVEQSDPPTATPVLADAIVKIGEACDELKKSGLNQEAIVVLLRHKTGVSMRDINSVLSGLRQLRGWYCKK